VVFLILFVDFGVDFCCFDERSIVEWGGVGFVGGGFVVLVDSFVG